MPQVHFVEDYERHVDNLLKAYPLDEAMSLAVGGSYEEIGALQADLLEDHGLRNGMDLIDLGCGSGRLAHQVGQRFPHIQYIGIDIVQKLLDYAASQCPSHFRFLLHREVTIPAPDHSTDFIVAFSLFTHLLLEESYCYMEECRRVLRPEGKLVFSFLQFGQPHHWSVFEQTVALRKLGTSYHMNTFIEESALALWAKHLEFNVEVIRDHPMGQTVAVFTVR